MGWSQKVFRMSKFSPQLWSKSERGKKIKVVGRTAYTLKGFDFGFNEVEI
jgi:hypothetical protein